MRIFLAAALALAATAGSLSAQAPTPAPSASATPEHFRPMEWLVGSCWIGTFPNGKETDEHCFEWVYDRRFVRDRHVVRGGKPYEGETLYGRRGKDAHVTYWYWSSSGGISTGRVDPVGDELHFPERHETKDGVLEMRSIWRRVDADHYSILVESRKDGAWKQMWTMEMTRKQ